MSAVAPAGNQGSSRTPRVGSAGLSPKNCIRPGHCRGRQPQHPGRQRRGVLRSGTPVDGVHGLGGIQRFGAVAVEVDEPAQQPLPAGYLDGYDFPRRSEEAGGDPEGDAGATRYRGDLRHRLSLDLPTDARVLEAAAIRARHALAYADGFAIATAVAHRATLLTGDPEILDDGDPT